MRRALAVVFLVVAAAGCPRGEDAHRQVEQTLADRENGLNRSDLQLYLSAISRAYGNDVSAPAGVSVPTFARLEKRAARMFTVIDKIVYTSSERSIYDEPDGRVRVIQRYAMELHPRRATDATSAPVTGAAPAVKSLSGQEQLWLVREADGRWRIVGGL
jgi:hypothetical protein